METEIGTFDRDTNKVPVTFNHNGVTHTRDVNACLNAKGKYDQEATAQRVEEVAAGVKHKIELGVITNPPPAAEQPSASEA